MQDTDDWSGGYMDHARLNLAAAEDMLTGGLAAEAISSSFLAMVYAARAALGRTDRDMGDMKEVVELFQAEAVPSLSLSKGNQRSLVIVGELYRQVEVTHEMEADPLTASACINDAREFVNELEEKIGLSE
ncbi:MAG: HEPN domain-containing protein [Actinomycetota bacterium]